MSSVAIPIPRDAVDQVLPRVLPHLTRAVDKSDGWTVDLAIRRIHNNQALLWAVIDGRETIGCALTELHDDCAYVALVGGVRWTEWRSELSKVEEWARLAGVRCVKIDGRRGWSRLLSRDGYQTDEAGTLSKDV